MKLLSTEIVRRYELEFSLDETELMKLIGMCPPWHEGPQIFTQTLPEIVELQKIVREHYKKTRDSELPLSERFAVFYGVLIKFEIEHRDDIAAYGPAIEIKR